MIVFGSLFAGIGGFDLGLERAGMVCKWQVEREPYAVRVLEKHWPEVKRHDDVCTFPPEQGNWEVDLICGGFPCQDISVAGNGAGLAGERSGLWHEMLRIISEIRPRWVIVENVAALLSRGMDTVLGELSEIGYDAEWHVIPASAVGAPHRRDRVWIVAHADRAGCKQQRRPEPESSQHATAERCGWWTTEPAVCRVVDGLPHRVDRLRGLGNAVVPQIVEFIGRRILETEEAQ